MKLKDKHHRRRHVRKQRTMRLYRRVGSAGQCTVHPAVCQDPPDKQHFFNIMAEYKQLDLRFSMSQIGPVRA